MSGKDCCQARCIYIHLSWQVCFISCQARCVISCQVWSELGVYDEQRYCVFVAGSTRSRRRRFSFCRSKDFSAIGSMTLLNFFTTMIALIRSTASYLQYCGTGVSVAYMYDATQMLSMLVGFCTTGLASPCLYVNTTIFPIADK